MGAFLSNFSRSNVAYYGAGSLFANTLLKDVSGEK